MLLCALTIAIFLSICAQIITLVKTLLFIQKSARNPAITVIVRVNKSMMPLAFCRISLCFSSSKKQRHLHATAFLSLFLIVT